MTQQRFKSIDIAKAELDQLRWFAEFSAQIPNARTMNTVTLKAKILAMQPDGKILVPDGELGDGRQETTTALPTAAEMKQAAEKAGGHAPLRAGSFQTGELAEVLISTSQEAGGSRPVFVAVNGVPMLIARGIPQKIGVAYLGVLENAVQTIWAMDDDGRLSSAEVPLYPMNIMVDPRWKDAEWAERRRTDLARKHAA